MTASYEIKVVQLDIETPLKKVEEKLNKPASEGWKLETVVEAFPKSSDFMSAYNYIFQRPKEG